MERLQTLTLERTRDPARRAAAPHVVGDGEAEVERLEAKLDRMMAVLSGLVAVTGLLVVSSLLLVLGAGGPASLGAGVLSAVAMVAADRRATGPRPTDHDD